MGMKKETGAKFYGWLSICAFNHVRAQIATFEHTITRLVFDKDL